MKIKVGLHQQAIELRRNMSFYFTITFEVQYKSVLEATSLLAAVFLAAAVFMIMRGYRIFSKALNFKGFHVDRCHYRRPVQEENPDSNRKV